MIRRTFVTALALLVATAAFAQRGHVTVPGPIPGTTVTGIVSAVNGSSVSLANGAVTLDVSHATITDDHGGPTTITPGSLIFAMLQSSSSLVASSVVVSRTPQVTLTGPVQSVNASAGTLQLLGLTIHTDANTSIGGDRGVHRLADIAMNDVVIVQANNVNGQLVATSILVFPVMQQIFPTLLHGTVKQIGTDAWVITDTHRGDTTVLVNQQTHIIGSPKVGDTVDVLANVDAAHNFVAISISVSPVPIIGLHFIGVVNQIGSQSWVISNRIVQVNANTKIIGDPKVGDRVDVALDPNSALNVALSITKL